MTKEMMARRTRPPTVPPTMGPTTDLVDVGGPSEPGKYVGVAVAGKTTTVVASVFWLHCPARTVWAVAASDELHCDTAQEIMFSKMVGSEHISAS